MDKIIILVRAGSPLTEDDARRSADVLAEITLNAERIATQPEVKGLVVSSVDLALAPEDDLVAMVEVWTDTADRAALVRGLVPAGAEARHGLRVSAVSTSVIVFREVFALAGKSTAWRTKLAGTAFRREDFTLEAFFDYWCNTHAPIGGHIPGIGGYTVSRVHDVVLGDEPADALIEQWFADKAAFDAAQEGPQAAAAWEDVGNYAKTTGVFWLMSEKVIVTPPPSGPGSLDTPDA